MNTRENFSTGYRNLIFTKVEYRNLIAKTQTPTQSRVNIWTREIETLKMEMNTNKSKEKIIIYKQHKLERQHTNL